MKTEEI